MTISAHEPCTKFLGPNAPWFPVATGVSVYMQLHNLTPGANWIPGQESIIYARRLLTRLPGTLVFRYYDTNCKWWIVYTKTICRISCRWDPQGYFLFQLFLFHGLVQWGRNRIVTPAGNFSYNGQVTISWQQ